VDRWTCFRDNRGCRHETDEPIKELPRHDCVSGLHCAGRCIDPEFCFYDELDPTP
jgi:hypothetical protein